MQVKVSVGVSSYPLAPLAPAKARAGLLEGAFCPLEPRQRSPNSSSTRFASGVDRAPGRRPPMPAGSPPPLRVPRLASASPQAEHFKPAGYAWAHIDQSSGTFGDIELAIADHSLDRESGFVAAARFAVAPDMRLSHPRP